MLERNQNEEFLKKAADEEYLWVKVGNTRRQYFNLYIELFILISLRVATCNDHGSLRCLSMRLIINCFGYQPRPIRRQYVLILDRKTKISRSVTMLEEAFLVKAVQICRKYKKVQFKDFSCYMASIKFLFKKWLHLLGSLLQKVIWTWN